MTETTRLVLDHGASGAPIFDCAGRVVAVASNLLTTSIQFGSHAVYCQSKRIVLLMWEILRVFHEFGRIDGTA
jgi:hypothetical protein